MWEKISQSILVNNFVVRGLVLAVIFLAIIFTYLEIQDGNISFVYNNF